MGQKSFDLAAEEQQVLVLVVVEGLDAEDVPRAEKGAVRFIPNDEGEHAPQLFGQRLAPFLVAVQQHLGVRVGGEHVARRGELLAQLHEVVNFAVEHRHEVFVLVEHGLAAALQVDDGQPPVPQRRLPVHIKALAVRPAVGDEVGHGLQGLFRFFKLVLCANKAGNSTHWLLLLPGSVHQALVAEIAFVFAVVVQLVLDVPDAAL